MATQERDLGGWGNFWAGLTGQSRTTVSPYQEDPNAFKQVGYGNNKAALAAEIARSQQAENNPYQMQAYMAAGPNMDQSNEWRAKQINLANALSEQAAGRGPSVAAEQLRQGVDKNIAATAALAGSMRGGNAALNARQVLAGAGSANQQAASDGATLRVQEQLNAQNALGALTQAGRGQDLSAAGLTNQNNEFNANQQQHASETNAQMAQQNKQFMMNRISDLMSKGMSLDMAQSQANMELQKFRAQNQQTADNANAQIASTNATNQGAFAKALLGGGMSGASGALGKIGGGGGGKTDKTDNTATKDNGAIDSGETTIEGDGMDNPGGGWGQGDFGGSSYGDWG